MANQRLNATIQIGGTVAKSLTRGLTNTKGQLGEVGTSIQKATRRQVMLSREIGKMGRQGMNVEPLRRQYAQLGDEIDRLRRKQEGLQRLADANVGGKLSNMVGEVGRLGRRAAMVGGAVGAGIFGIANSTAELGDNVAKTADKLGMGIEELQAYRYAAERSGVASKTFDMATQRMVRRVAEAANGSGEAKDAIKELGLSAQALASMTPDEQLNHFADALKGVENQGERVRIAMKLFDSEGVAMVNMLREGSEGLRQYGEDARRTGYILSDQAARDAETFQDKLLDTKLSLFGLKNIIGSALMPVVSDMMSKFTGWLSENRTQVREWSSLFAERLQAAVPVIADLASGIGTVVTKVGNAISVTADLVGGFDNLGMIIGTVFAGKAIASIASFGVSLWSAGGALLHLAGGLPVVAGGIKAIGAALMANPIGLIIGAIAGAGYLIYRNWERIGPWFKGLWQGVKDTAAWAWDKVKAIVAWSPLGVITRNWETITGWLDGLLTGVKKAASATWEGVKTILAWSPLGLIASAWSGLTTKVGGIVESAQDKVSGAWGWIKGKLAWSPLDTISNAWNGLTDKVGSVLNSAKGRAAVWETVKAVFQWSPLGLIASAWAGLTTKVGGIVESAQDKVSAAWDWMKAKLAWSPLGTISNSWSGLTTKVGGIVESAQDKVSSAWGWIKGKLSWSPLDAISNAWNGLTDKVGSVLSSAKGRAAVWETVKAVFQWSPLGLIASAWAGLTTKVGGIVESAQDKVSSAWDWMKAKLSWSPMETVANAWGGLSDWFGGMWEGITGAAQKALDWITGKLDFVGKSFSKVKGWLSWGDDESADEAREPLGGGNAGALGLSRVGETQQAEGEQPRALAQTAETQTYGPPPPTFNEARPSPAEKVREVVNNITNNLTLHVTRREGEEDASYAQRIADMVIEELNGRQQGALYDG